MFRYSEKRWNDSLLKMGSLRVGTLYDFRKIEYGKGISDPDEGKKTVFHDESYRHIASSESPAEDPRFDGLRAVGYEFTGALTNVTFKNVGGSRTYEDKDCFIFCTSHKLSYEVMNSLEKADDCLCIFNSNEFYKKLTDCINAQCPVEFRGFHKVSYRSRREGWKGGQGLSPMLIKDEKFSAQCETRAIWIPRDESPIKPLIVLDHLLGRYVCRMKI